MSTDNRNDVSKSEGHSESKSRSESTSSGRGGIIISSSGESATGEPITPETHRPEDLKTHQHVADASAQGKSTWIDRMRSLFGGKK